MVVLGKASRTHSENHSELGGNTLGIKKSLKKVLKHPLPSRKNRRPSWVDVEPSHWVPEISIPKTVCYQFWHGLS